MLVRGLASATLLLVLGGAALAAPCRTSGTYEAWLAALSAKPRRKGFPSAPLPQPRHR